MYTFKMDHVYCCQMKAYSDEVESVHEVGPNTGQHWAEGGSCWCEPTLLSDEVPGLPHKVKVFIHKTYKPNWG